MASGVLVVRQSRPKTRSTRTTKPESVRGFAFSAGYEKPVSDILPILKNTVNEAARITKKAAMNTIHTETPPVIREVDGQWFIVVTDGKTEMIARIGTWFAAQFATRVIVPKLALDALKEKQQS